MENDEKKPHDMSLNIIDKGNVKMLLHEPDYIWPDNIPPLTADQENEGIRMTHFFAKAYSREYCKRQALELDKPQIDEGYVHHINKA